MFWTDQSSGLMGTSAKHLKGIWFGSAAINLFIISVIHILRCGPLHVGLLLHRGDRAKTIMVSFSLKSRKGRCTRPPNTLDEYWPVAAESCWALHCRVIMEHIIFELIFDAYKLLSLFFFAIADMCVETTFAKSLYSWPAVAAVCLAYAFGCSFPALSNIS